MKRLKSKNWILLSALAVSLLSGCGKSDPNSNNVITSPSLGPTPGCQAGQMVNPHTGTPCYAGTFAQNCAYLGGQIVVGGGKELCRTVQLVYKKGIFSPLDTTLNAIVRGSPIPVVGEYEFSANRPIELLVQVKKDETIEVRGSGKWGEVDKRVLGLPTSCDYSLSVPGDLSIGIGGQVYRGDSDPFNTDSKFSIQAQNSGSLSIGFDPYGMPSSINDQCYRFDIDQIVVRRCRDSSDTTYPCPTP